MYTIRDIARLAQVSTATVSYVINEKGRVSDTLKKRVLEAMAALDYHPDQVARSLKVRRTFVIGVVIPDVSNPFFAEVMRGIEDEARKFGYAVIFCNTNEDADLEQKHLDTLAARRVDGVIISSATVNVGARRSSRRRAPIVFFDRIPPVYSGPAVVSDNLGAARRGTRFLVDLGHTRIAIITGLQDLSVARARLDGFREALRNAGIALPSEYVKFGDFLKLESGYRTATELMKLPNPPTAVFCCNNKMTLGLMHALGDLNVACPEQVSVLAFDDFEWVASFRPQLTAIAQPTHLMGRKATEMLVNTINAQMAGKNEAGDQMVVLPLELHVRGSTGPPP